MVVSSFGESGPFFDDTHLLSQVVKLEELVFLGEQVKVVVGLRGKALGGPFTVHVGGRSEPNFGSLVSVGCHWQVCGTGKDRRQASRRARIEKIVRENRLGLTSGFHPAKRASTGTAGARRLTVQCCPPERFVQSDQPCRNPSKQDRH
jgi:hypothetical protein